MGRAKKKIDFEIDFKFPQRSRELLYNADGTEKYDLPTVFSFFDAHPDANQYVRDFAKSVKEQYTKNGGISPNQQWTLYSYAANLSPAWDELNTRFFEWYDSREDMQTMYRECAPNIYWHYDRYGQHHDKSYAYSKGWIDRPDNWVMFHAVAYSGEGNRYRELNREIVYDVGDQVMLRTPFKGKHSYDPCYGMGLPMTDERIGMVIEHKDSISRKSRGGKGSRLINVLWLTNGEQRAVPERIIKKYRAPKP